MTVGHAAAVRVDWVEDEAGLDELEPVWERLAAETRVPFARHAWMRAWWRAFGRGRLAVAVAELDGEPAAILPLERRGNMLHALANEHSPLFTPLGSGAALAAAVDAAIGASRALVLPGMTEGRPELDAVRAGARRTRRLFHETLSQTQPLVRLEGSFADYWSALGSKLRSDIGRRRKRLDSELHPVYRMLESPGDLDRQLTLGFETEASGWKGEAGTAILADPAVEGFYREVARVFARTGRFAVSAIEVDGRHAAFSLCYLDGNRLWLPKGGIDDRYRRFAPGLVLIVSMIERAYDLGLEAVELLGESVPWKARLANEERVQLSVGVYRGGPSGLVRYAAARSRPKVRAVYRRFRPAR
ncbi:MAG TPA: GNAT family N-acetyltransferase [Gaiellaceae bacterium]|nr:GNAT family N-acetyltransferase [Gaiellaceae bacterium]